MIGSISLSKIRLAFILIDFFSHSIWGSILVFYHILISVPLLTPSFLDILYYIFSSEVLFGHEDTKYI